MVKYVFSLMILFVALPSTMAIATEQGSLCVAAMPGKDNKLGPVMSPASTYVAPDASIRVKIDAQQMYASLDGGGEILGLSLHHQHLVQLFSQGKAKLSFWLDFTKHDSALLCLWYYPSYGTFSVIPRQWQKCHCDK